MATSTSILKITPVEGGVHLHPSVDLIASKVEALREGFQGALEGVSGRVTLSLEGITQIDSLGVTLVLGLFKSCQKLDLAFEVVDVDRNLVRVFRLFNLTKFFAVKEGPAHE
jgi:anti-anti-sigma factor